MGEPLKTVEEKVLVQIIETEIGKINVYKINRDYTEQEIDRQKEEFYALLARLLLSNSLGEEIESVNDP